MPVSFLTASLHVFPRIPGGAGAIKKFVFLGGCEETTAYLCLKTYFVVSRVIYRNLDFLFSLHFVSNPFPSFLPSLLIASLLKGPGRSERLISSPAGFR